MEHPPSSKIWLNHRSCAVGVMLLTGLLCPGVIAQPNPPAEAPMRVGFSSTIFMGLNVADAHNSIKALTARLAKEYDIPTEENPLIYESLDEAEKILNNHQIGAINMPTCDYWLLRRNIQFDRFLITTRNGTPNEVYLLVALENGLVSSLADLRDKHLMVLSSPAMNLAAVWLDVELAKKSLPQTTKLVGKITEATKAAKTVLPVFFNQADACLITRRAFDTMVELNPQVGRQLRVIATSPDYIASLFGFLTDVPTELKEKTIRAFSRLHTTTIGLQTLTLFQTDTILECPVATFAPSLALLDEHARLCPEASAALITSLRDPHHAP